MLISTGKKSGAKDILVFKSQVTDLLYKCIGVSITGNKSGAGYIPVYLSQVRSLVLEVYVFICHRVKGWW